MSPAAVDNPSPETSTASSPVLVTPFDNSDAHSFDGFSNGLGLAAGRPDFATPLTPVAPRLHEREHDHFDAACGAGMDDAEPTHQPMMPIAIVGMACRLPGNVASPDEFWNLCSRARTGFTPVPKERFNHDVFYHPNPGKTGTYHAVGGNFLDVDVTAFDAPFFGLTEKEAISMDPQQRLLLECTFEALENAGIPKHSIVGKDVGVFIGGSFAEYESHLFRDSDTIPMHQATGCAHAMQSNRLSHFFDLRGPSFTADTACSSSLIALHLACQSLRTGESTQAIVGGCHLNMLPEFWVSFSSCRLLSDSGRSIAFDNRGTGFGRGEGCGIIVLKPLDQALRDNDSIRAVIRGSGTNQDGKTPGITMPSGLAQERLMKKIYRNAGLDTLDCGFVEAHGTGTKVGDPIEATAIHNALGQGRSVKDPLYIGSVKSNIGHLEAASGIVAVIKAALMLERGFILPNHDYKLPNEKIPWKEWNMKIVKTQRPWPKGKKYISVNNFGFGGSNAHIVLGKAPFQQSALAPKLPPHLANSPEKKTAASRKLFVITANDKSSLAAAIKKIVIYLEQRPEIFQMDLMKNVAYTLGQRRSLLQWRVAIPAMDSFSLIETLNSDKVAPSKIELEPLRIGFIFTGQGAQWHGMGRELYEQYPTYTAAIDRADECLRRLGAEWSLVQELLHRDAKTSQVSEAHISQPACTAVQLALTDLLRTWGIRPVAVAGHSSGEICAAYSAGIITFESAMSIAYHRGRLVPVLKQRNPGLKGAMMAVGGTKEEVQPMIDGLVSQDQQVRIACYNSPSSLTISGDAAVLTDLETVMNDKQMFNRRLQVDVAYHSHHMDLVAKDYQQSIQSLPHPQITDTQFYSSLYGNQIEGSECEAHYWVNNLTCPVRFSEALETMLDRANINAIIELGPHSALQGPIKQILKAVGGTATKLPYSSALARGKDAVETAMQLAGSLLMKGVNLHMDAINFPTSVKSPTMLTDLPRYSWNHQNKYWHESRMTQMHKYRTSPRNDLIGLTAIYSNDLEPTWRNIVHLDDLPWLRHHQIQSLTLFPISGFIAMALEAANQWSLQKEIQFDRFELRDVSIIKPLVLSDTDLEMTISLKPQGGTTLTSEAWSKFTICSWSHANGWTEHCVGHVATQCHGANEVERARQETSSRSAVDKAISAIQASKVNSIAGMKVYESLSKLDVTYGPSFQGITSCKASDNYSSGDIAVADIAQDMPNNYMTSTVLHPTTLESVIEMYWPVLGAGQSPVNTVYLPSSVGRMSISRNVTALSQKPGSTLTAYCQADFSASSPRPTNVAIFATASEQSKDIIIEIHDLTVSPILEGEMELNAKAARELCYKLEWEAVPESSIGASSPKINPSSPDVEIAIIHGESNFQRLVANELAILLETATSRLPSIGTIEDAYPEGKYYIVLTEIDQPFLANPTEDQFRAVQKMTATAQGILWISRGAYDNSTSPDSNMISGLSRTVRSETLLPFATLDLDGNRKMNEQSTTKAVFDIFKAVYGCPATGELEFMERTGNFFTARVVHDEEMNEYVHRQTNPSALELQPFKQENRPLRMEVSSSGAIETLHFVEDSSVETALAPDEIEFEVKAIGLNAVDVMVAKGQVPSVDSHALGLEASGVITGIGSGVTSFAVGNRIAALTIAKGAYATRTRTTASTAFTIPATLSFQEAATLPLAYCTAYYSLIEKARLQEGQRVLIHAAGDCVGQAAVCLAQMIGAEVFATVSSAEKKALLISEYAVPEERIFYNGNTAFGAAVSRATDGQGVDVVLNSLTGAETLRESWGCLTRFGSLVDIGQRHGAGATHVEMEHVDNNASFMSVDIFGLAAERPKVMKMLVANVAQLMRYGKIRPIVPATVFPVSDVEAAFKILQSSQAPGKLVVVPSADDMVMATPSKSLKNLLRPDFTYVLIGGTGGLGRSMARWMITNGAKSIVLLSRSGSGTGKIRELVEDAKAVGANIVIRRCNVADPSSVEELFTTGLHGLPPVRGVIHGAMVLHDVLFEKMTWNEYTTVCESKVQGAWNFHHALQKHKTPVDFFVAISSAAGVVGNRGQAAYAAANTFLNAFVQHRISQGLPAVSLDLTAVSDAGYLADIGAERAAEVAKNLGSDSICEAEVLALLGAAIAGRTVACNHHVITGMRITPTIQPFWTPDAKFKALRLAAEALAEASAGSNATAISPNAALRSARTSAQAEEVVCRGLVDKISSVLMLEAEDMDVTRSLSHYPLDSLVAIEIRNFITREFEANLQVLELLSSGSIQTLTKAVCHKSKLCVGLE